MTVEVKKRKQSEKMAEITQVDGFKCKCVIHPRFNYSKGLIYIHDCDTENVEEFSVGLKERYIVIDVQAAPFIKTKSLRAKALMCMYY